jgi:putative DNA primase/helicase
MKGKEPLAAVTANDPQKADSTKDGTNMNDTPKQQPQQESFIKPVRLELSNLTPPPEILKNKEIKNKLMSAPLTDAGNAECFIAIYKDSLRYCKSRKTWLMWRDNKWSIDEAGKAHRGAIITARARRLAANSLASDDAKTSLRKWAKDSESQAKRNAMLNTAMHLKPMETTIEDYDRDQYLIGVRNGCLDLRTGEFREAKQEDYISMQLNVEYDAQAKAPRWEGFLSEIFNGDEELISFIKRAVGYSLTGATSEQVMFMLHGHGANGKSVLLEVISRLLGGYAANTPFTTFEANKRNESTNDLAALKGKRFVTTIETNEDRRLDEARVKSITGGDDITCRFLFSEYFTYKPTFKIWMAVNHKPLIRGTDRGIWRRIRLIPFNQNFEGEKGDKSLTSKLLTELPGILNWALEGLMEWKEHGLGAAKAIEISTETYRHESDLVQQWLDEWVTIDANETISAAEAYSSFQEWALTRGYPKFSMNSFGRLMTEKGFERKSNGKCRIYVGLKLDELGS